MDDIMEDIVDETVDIFGNPENSPRVGEEYQADIPSLMTKDVYLQLIKIPACADTLIDDSNHFGMRLPVPVTWVHDQAENINREGTKVYAKSVEAESTKDSQVLAGEETSKDKAESLVSASNDVERMKRVSSFEPSSYSHCGVEGLIPLPDLSNEAWKDIEHASFLLGLYIFGKNLCVVKKMVGSKGIGCILSYYYGEFYRSREYKRWSDCRKSRTRRSIHGERIFTSWRQQELLSRLSSKVTEECKSNITEASRLFGEGKLSLEEYVFSLKDMVGINCLVEAVAIGKGKQDLTGISMEPLKTNHSFRVRSEVPVGQACSSLTLDEIVKLLTGDVRLSKARSSDLFWEAIWPRLLARGWHSEQPRSYVSHGSKNPLVFLIPGVKKFSRRRLLKGSHYFDSPTDVLNKVASEPQLLDIEAEAVAKEDELDPQMKEKDTDGFSSKRHCYLQVQPRRPSQCSTRDHMKFTIVDTSMVCGDGRIKVRELRSLPVEVQPMMHSSTSSSTSGETERDTSEESHNGVEEECNHTPKLDHEQDATESVDFVNSPECEVSNFISRFVNQKDQNASEADGGLSRIKHEHKFSQTMKSCQSNDLAPSSDNKYRGHRESSDGNCFQTEIDQNPLFAGYSASILEDKSESSLSDKYEGSTEPSTEERQPMNMIDLNLPHVPVDTDRDKPIVTQSEASKRSPDTFNTSNNGVGQRQSTRNRPLTTKALEALALGFLSPKKNRKGGSRNNSNQKPSRRVRAKTALFASSSVEEDDALL